jgi:hypothetical protein
VLLPNIMLNGLLLLKELLLNELLPELNGLLLNELLPVELLKNVLLPELNGLLPLDDELPKKPLNGLLLNELLPELKELLLPEKDPLLLVELTAAMTGSCASAPNAWRNNEWPQREFPRAGDAITALNLIEYLGYPSHRRALLDDTRGHSAP